MCQYNVTKSLEPMRKQFPNFLVIHYMDDLLFSTPSVLETQQMFDITQACLKASRLIIAPEKIQTSTPHYYLRFVVSRQHITPQLTQIHVNKLSTSNDFKKLLGNINWTLFRHYKLSANLFSTLKRDPDLNSPHSLSQEAQEELSLKQNKLQTVLTHNRLDLPPKLFILPSFHSPTGLPTQQEYPIEWIYTHFRGTRSLTRYLDLITLIISNGKNRSRALIGLDPHKIVEHINKSQFKNTLQTSTDFQIAFLQYFG